MDNQNTPYLTNEVVNAEASLEAKLRAKLHTKIALAKAQQDLANARAAVVTQAAQAGVAIGVSKCVAYAKRAPGHSRWPLELVQMLYRDKGLCEQSNAVLAKKVSEKMKLDRPIPANALSKELHKHQHKSVTEYLQRIGVVGNFTNMSGVKNLIKGGPSATKRKAKINVSGDISTDGNRLTIGKKSYRMADKPTPTGDILRDKLVWIHGHRTPLGVVLALLDVIDDHGREMYTAGVAATQAEEANKERLRLEAAQADELNFDIDSPL